MKSIHAYQGEEGHHHQEGLRWISAYVQWNVVSKKCSVLPGSHTKCSAYGDSFIVASKDDNSVLWPCTNNMIMRNMENPVVIMSHVVPDPQKIGVANHIKEKILSLCF